MSSTVLVRSLGWRAVVALMSGVLLAGSARALSRFTVDQALSFPFPEGLVASPTGSVIAWTVNARGKRNVFVAEGPAFVPRQLTHYDADDGHELTSLRFSPDGRFLVFVRGGDHGANWSADGRLAPNPTSQPVQPKEQILSIRVAGGEPVLLGEGDEPVVAAGSQRVAFVRDGRIHAAPIDGSSPASPLFSARGESGSPVWSPDGQTLAFVTDRGAQRYIALYRDGQPIRYVAPSTSRDESPRWSPDGRQLAFVRTPGRGGPVPDPLKLLPTTWSIWVADATTLEGRKVWQSGGALVDGLPQTLGGANLDWAAGDRLVFLSYQDGWPHLYSKPATGGTPLLLTPGPFMVEYVALSPDRRFLVYNANAGTQPDDVDRRHLFRVAVDHAEPTALSSGPGIEWAPAITSDGRTLAYLSSDARRPALPAVRSLEGGDPRLLGVELVPADYPTTAFVQPTRVVVKAPDGVDVPCQLFLPAEKIAGKRPALLFVHGGPPRQMLLGHHYMYYYANTYALNQYLASRGFVVLSVNYRLGIGYGHAFHHPADAGSRGASEYQDVLAAGRYLQTRSDVDASRVGVWGGSYGGYLAALALGRSSDVFRAGVDIHGVHNRVQPMAPQLVASATAGDGVGVRELERALRVAFAASPISAIATWTSPVLLIHGDDDRNVRFEQTVDLARRLEAKGVHVEQIVIPDDIHDFLLFSNWKRVGDATAAFFERQLSSAKAPASPTSAR